MNLIEQLHQFVTPRILELVKDQPGTDDSKTGLLSSLYGLLGARLSDPETVTRLEQLTPEEQEHGGRILDTLLQDEHGNSQAAVLTTELAKEHQLPETTVSAISTAAAPLLLTQLKGLANGGSIAVFLQDKLVDLAAYLPDWAEKLIPLGLLTGLAGFAGSAVAGVGNVASGLGSSIGNLAGKAVDAVSDTTDSLKAGASSVVDGAKDTVSNTAAHVNHQVEAIKKDDGSFMKALLPIVGLVIFAGLAWMMLRGCQEKTTPVAVPPTATPASQAAATPTANATPATFKASTDETGNTLYACQAQAGSESVFASIRTALSGVFGVTDKCQFNTQAGYAETLPAGDKLPQLFALMKGVPNSSINIDGTTVRFNAADAAAVTKLVEGAKGILGEGFTVEAEPKLDAAAAVANSINSAKTAIESLGDSTDAAALVKALNMQIINFATASSEIPAENKAILDLAATKLANLPNAKLKITGHTDSQGNHNSNKTLSEQRAAAVRDYLVAKGVPSDRLEVRGASSDEPIATNATEQGRFQNRRIEFTLVESNGDVTAVGNASNSQAVATTENQAAPTTQTQNK